MHELAVLMHVECRRALPRAWSRTLHTRACCSSGKHACIRVPCAAPTNAAVAPGVNIGERPKPMDASEQWTQVSTFLHSTRKRPFHRNEARTTPLTQPAYAQCEADDASMTCDSMSACGCSCEPTRGGACTCTCTHARTAVNGMRDGLQATRGVDQ